LSFKSKVITIVNDSCLIGKPLSAYLLTKGATVLICNEFTKNLAKFTKQADILITATGKAGLITASMVKKGSYIIDAGISKVKGKTLGDVDFNSVSKIAKAITPVPGGVGPVTVACLMKNLLKLYESQKK
jgi:methylenetetrahydrofolate dehydrogenase (NADP+)/methenyltetrahydrofolate cyclohydrolase